MTLNWKIVYRESTNEIGHILFLFEFGNFPKPCVDVGSGIYEYFSHHALFENGWKIIGKL